MHNISDIEAAGKVIGKFYGAAASENTWDDALREASIFLGCHASTLSSHLPHERKSKVEGGEYNTDPEYTRSFNETYGPLSSFAMFTMLAQEGVATHTDRFWPREDFLASRFYKEWCAPQRYSEFMGCTLIRETRAIYAIGLVRVDDQPPITDDDVRLLGVLVPHITRAVRIARVFGSMEAKQDNLLGTLDSLPSPVITVDAALKVVTINRAGASLVAKGDVIQLRHGRLTLCDAAKQAGLEATFVNGQVEPASFQLPGNPPLTAHIMP
jgi:PAS domain-containing protein